MAEVGTRAGAADDCGRDLAEVGTHAGAVDDCGTDLAEVGPRAGAVEDWGSDSTEVGPRAGAVDGAIAVSENGRARRRSADDRETPCWRGRYIPAAVRRAVAARDALRCSYVDEGGRRCVETHWLEFHHLVAFARGGEHSAENVTLRCRCHNLLAAEGDFGRERMQEARERQVHESLAKQEAFARGGRAG